MQPRVVLVYGPRQVETALLGGSFLMAQMGDPKVCIPTPQPVYSRPMFGACGGSLEHAAVTFVTAAAEARASAKRQASKTTPAVENTRMIGKKIPILNNATPKIQVNPETWEVRADGEQLTCQPAEVPPMAQRHFLILSQVMDNP